MRQLPQNRDRWYVAQGDLGLDALAWLLVYRVETERWGYWLGPKWQRLWAD